MPGTCAVHKVYMHNSYNIIAAYVHTYTYVHTYIPLLTVCYTHRWMQLLSVTDERKALLEGAEHVHQFVRDVDETDDRMSDKVLCITFNYSNRTITKIDINF